MEASEETEATSEQERGQGFLSFAQAFCPGCVAAIIRIRGKWVVPLPQQVG